MVDVVGADAPHKSRAIGKTRKVRKKFSEFHGAVTVLAETVGRTEKLGLGVNEGETLSLDQFVGNHLSIVLHQFGLGVEQLQMRDTSA